MMENPCSSKEKVIGYWTAPGAQPDNSGQFDNGVRIPVPDDPFCNFADLMNFDSYAGLYNSPSGADQIFSSYMLPNFQSGPYGSFDQLNFVDQSPLSFPDRAGALGPVGNSYYYGKQQADTRSDCQGDITDGKDLRDRESEGLFERARVPDACGAVVTRPLGPSLDEKMLRALSLFKESSGGGILAQVWVPMKHDDHFILSTYEQPFLLDKMLEGYREVSRGYTFAVEGKPGTYPGLPGRVFISKVPEWTSNVIHYNHTEYLRVKHAIDHNIRGSIALPVFDSNEKSCCAVLELVTMKEKPNFDSEMEKVCVALQAVNLRTTPPPQLLPQSLSKNQRAALAEITDVLRAVCHAHRFPLALTWIPCVYTEGDVDDAVRVHVREGNRNPNEKCILCIEDSACYVNDKDMEGFVHACAEHYLKEGQGIAGKALQSNYPFFFSDVKAYDISEYPLVHHARRFGLNAAVAIRLRSTCTGDDDYILEFFLPVNIKGSVEQQLLLDNLSRTMQRICRTLRTVSDAELVGGEEPKMGCQEAIMPNHSRTTGSKRGSLAVSSGNSVSTIDGKPLYTSKSDGLDSDGPCEQATSGSRKQHEKKKSTAEKTVSLSVLQQYFSGSLKDAAKSIGVCPTTLKRICRQHGISRWPSRKINKVNRSLRKIQTVLDSVQGVEGGLKFDPTTGGFVAAGPASQELATQKTLIFPEKSAGAKGLESLVQERISVTGIDVETTAVKLEEDAFLGEVKEPIILETKQGNIMDKRMPQCSRSFALGDEMDTGVEGDDGIVVHNRMTSSSMTESSNGSGSFTHGGSSSSSQSFEEGKHSSKPEPNSGDSGAKITVKATYKDDTIRFKFEPGAGCFQLYEEVSRRFKIQNGMFQLKYLDDEDEWVMLVSDSDLQECLDILEYSGTRSVKFLVRDLPAPMGSSGSSNCFLMGGS